VAEGCPEGKPQPGEGVNEMPLFVCDKCGCVDNTAFGRYWSKDLEEWGDDNRGLALCSECAPTHFKDGKPARNLHGLSQYGKWHNEFPKVKWDGEVEVINRPQKKQQ